MTTKRLPLNRQTCTDQPIYPERIVQFGAGNFLRGFADWIIQTLNEQTDFSAAVVVVKVTPGSKYDALDAQDGLYHVRIEGIEAEKVVAQTHLISCITRTVYPHHDFSAYLALATQPEIRFIISNTTEAGISYQPSDQFDDAPASAFPAKLTQFLYHRYQHFDGAADKGCIVIPTELIESNGTQLKALILRYAEQWALDAGFVQWINTANLFCDTLVDRIVPGFPPPAKREALLDDISYDDQQLVTCEPYHSWIIQAPPELKHALPVEQTPLNVKIVDDAEPYRQTKVRILNGTHTAMTMTGCLLGLTTVKESIEHPALAQFLHDLVAHEIIPAMALPPAELAQFAKDTFSRFHNPHIEHRLRSITVNSSAKITTRLLPTLKDYHAKFDQLPPRTVLAIAAFIQLYAAQPSAITPCEACLPLSDDAQILQWFSDQWHAYEQHGSIEQLTAHVLQNQTLWGEDLNLIDGLHAQLSQYLSQIQRDGVLSLIQQING